jgi:hypothetical protein
MNFYEFATETPWLAFFLLWLVVKGVVRIVELLQPEAECGCEEEEQE